MTVRHPSRRRSVIALVILVVIVTAMAIIIRNTGTSQPLTDPTAAPTPALPPNPTLLVQLRDDGLTNVDSVVMGLDTADKRGSSWYLPQNLVVDLVAGRDETLGLTGFKPISEAAGLVRAQTGVRVDNTFVLDRLAFAGLVDAVGGVTLTIEQPLVVKDRFGNVTEVIPLGERTLDGPQAAAYALYLGPGQPETERMDRFEQVWQAVLAKLPANADQMRAILGSLGALARATAPLAQLADFLVVAGDYARANAWATGDLPTRPGAYGPLPLAWIEPASAQVQALALFGEDGLVGADAPLRVRTYRAGASTTQTEQARDDLTDAGLAFVWSGPTLPVAATRVIAAAPEYQQGATQAAEAVGVSATAVTVEPQASPGAPVTMVLAAPAPAPPTPAPTVAGTPGAGTPGAGAAATEAPAAETATTPEQG
jgi:hypothetical protein